MPAAVNYANSESNIDGCCGVDFNLATSAIGAGTDSDVRATRVVMGKSGKSVAAGFVTKVSQLSSRTI